MGSRRSGQTKEVGCTRRSDLNKKRGLHYLDHITEF